jgi:hypothetical protein
MGHDKALNDGKKKRDATKTLKERRVEKKTKHEDTPHVRLKPRWKKEPQH